LSAAAATSPLLSSPLLSSPLLSSFLLSSPLLSSPHQDLARLSLHQAEYLSVHATHSDATPSKLVQNYVVCRLHDKLDVLYSFIKSHLKNKIVVFLSSCAQVRFVFECLRGMQPGIPLMALHGKIKQDKRTLIYLDYARKPAACLFATDIAARGLDFPDVDWVVQVDAPEDRAMYIHRVGRTARYTSGGRALLLLMPQEEKVVMEELTGGTAGGGKEKSASGDAKDKDKDKDRGKVVGSVNNIPLKKLSLNPKRTVQVSNRAAAMIVANPEYRALAKKSFLSYLKSLSLNNLRKHVYRWSPGELDAYATSLGLHQTPELPVQKQLADAPEEGGDETKKKKNVNRSLDKLKAQIKAAKEEKKRLREEKLGKKSAASGKEVVKEEEDSDDDEEEEEEDVLLVVKNEEGTSDLTHPAGDHAALAPSAENVAASIKATKRKKERGLKIGKDGETKKNTTRMLFDEEGALIDPLASLSKAFAAGGGGDSDSEEGEGEGAASRPGLSASIASRVREAKSRLDSVRKEDGKVQ
jgi:ATP-dependent RNA helicase DDX10/DBP4